MHYNHLLNTPQIQKVIKIQIAELFILTVLSMIAIIFVSPQLYTNETFANFGETPIVRVARWLIVVKSIWTLIEIRLFSKHKLHWYRFI